MKKIIILFILINSISCKKEWFDYTNKYTGKFQFTTDYTFFDLSTGVLFDTTYVYNGIIKKIKRGEIKIKYGNRQSESVDVEIDKEGKISEGDWLRGKFSDENNLTIYYQTGGHGGGGRCHITGIRN